MYMTSRSEQRKIWLVVGGLGFALIAIEILISHPSPMAWTISAAGAAAVIVAIVKYRSLRPRRRKSQ